MDFDDVNVIFIISNKYEDETQMSSIMKKAYTICNQNVRNTQWLREDDCEAMSFKKTDFVVFEQFEGDLYQLCLKTRCTILGPRCLYTCLSQDIQIPNVDWPLLNLTMMDCSVVCSNLSKEAKRSIMEKVQTMGGLYTPSMVPTNTHLITDNVRSEKYNKSTQQPGMKIMLPSWVDALWMASQTEEVSAHDEQFAKHKCLTFQNLRICMTGFTNAQEKKRLEKYIKENGGIFSNQLVLKATDILVCNGSTSDKYKAARKQKIECVSDDWIYDSVQKGYAISETSSYSVKKGTSTPTKSNEFLDPNFSIISTISGSTSSRSILQETMDNTVAAGYAPNISSRSSAGSMKRKSPNKADELVESIDIKRAKRAGPFLDGCCIYLAGFQSEPREKLCKVLNFSGATRYDTFSDRLTHIVVGDVTSHEVKLIRGKNVMCPMVSVSWVIDSMAQGQPVSEDDYFISAEQASRGDGHGSPLVKKGLKLLKADVSICAPETTPAEEEPADGLMDTEDEIMLQYLKQTTNSNATQEDTLAAVLAANHYDTNQHIQNKSKTIPMDSKVGNDSAPSISMSSDSDNTTTVAIFKNLTFCILGFDTENEEELKSCVEGFGGAVVKPDYRGVLDYAVVPIHGPLPLQLNATHVVTDMWLSDCNQHKAIPSEIGYHHRPLVVGSNILAGAVIGFSGFPPLEKGFLRLVSEQMGAVVQESLSRLKVPERSLLASTHLVAYEASGKKYDAAIKWNLFVVNRDWIVQCAVHDRRLDESEFLVENDDETFKSETINKSVSRVKSTPRLGSSRSRLAISVNSPTDPTRQSPTNNSTSTPGGSRGSINESLVRTPQHDNIENKESAFTTPVNNMNISTYCSQITPVNQILKEANMEINKTPVTPKPWSHVDTPDSPIGAFICNPPPAELKKKLHRWINTFPDHKPRERRLSTPMSELKRRLWNRVCPDYKPYTLKYGENNEEQSHSENEEVLNAHSSTPHSAGIKSDSQETPENKMVGEKLQQLHEVLLASGSGNSSRRNSAKRPLPIPMEQYPEKESQPFSVGWDEDMEVAMPQVNKPRFFMISGIDTDERDRLAAQIESLSACVLNLSNYEPASTHLVCRKLSRNEKLLASMASGKWVLHEAYIRDSVSAGKLLNEEEYEYGNEKSKIKVDSDDVDRAKCACYWRKAISQRGYGAFHDVKALVVANRRGPLVRVIEAGGGMVIEENPPFEKTLYATHCFMEIKSVPNFKDYIPLAQQGIYCVNTLYVSDFLHKKVTDIRDYILPPFVQYY